MAVTFKRDRAVFSGFVGVEEAETLLEWLQKHPGAKLDLAACEHLHPANLQVMMAARCSIKSPPADSELAAWLASAFEKGTLNVQNNKQGRS